MDSSTAGSIAEAKEASATLQAGLLLWQQVGAQPRMDGYGGAACTDVYTFSQRVYCAPRQPSNLAVANGHVTETLLSYTPEVSVSAPERIIYVIANMPSVAGP